MAFDEVLAQRLRDAIGRRRGFAEKRMFGGVAMLLDGNMCVGVAGDEVIVRVGPEAYDAMLFEPHVREFDFTGRPMKGWVVVEPEGIARDEALRTWVERAIAFVKTLPAK